MIVVVALKTSITTAISGLISGTSFATDNIRLIINSFTELIIENSYYFEYFFKNKLIDNICLICIYKTFIKYQFENE